MKTYLSKDQMLEAVNEEESGAYIGLKIMFDKMLTHTKEIIEVNFNITNLFYELSGSLEPTKTDKEKLRIGIQGLIDANVINLITQDTKDNYVLDIAKLAIKQNEPYTVTTREEIRSIFNIPCKQKFNLLRFGIGILGTINSQYKCGFASFETMTEITGISRKASCQDFFKRLEDNDIIYVHHSDKAKRDNNGEIKNLSNCYGRPCDKSSIDKYYADRCNREGHDFTNTMGSARKAKLTRNYNKFINGAYTGDVNTLIKECLVFNRIPYNEQNPEWQKDMSVFNKELIQVAKEGLQEHIKETKKIERQKEEENRRNNWCERLAPEADKYEDDDIFADVDF